MKASVSYFVSYARKDSKLAERFLGGLREQLAPSVRYSHSLWNDRAVLVGEDWDREIKAALANCDLGLLLLSPTFLTRDYINNVELPTLLNDQPKPILPVLLRNVDLQRHDLLGIDKHQIFCAQDNQENPRSFEACRDSLARVNFVEQLFAQIEQRLDKLFQTEVR